MSWLWLLAFAVIISGCKRPAASTEPAATQQIDPHALEKRTTAELGTAKTRLEQGRPDEALAHLVNALEISPASSEAKNLLEKTLAETSWFFPETTITHSAPIDQISYLPPASLWVNLGGKIKTTVLWDLEELAIKSVLFPHPDGGNRGSILDPSGQYIVIQRGKATLLCHAASLKPVCDLGNLPDSLIASAVVVFSADGLLVAHPSHASDDDPSMIWHLRETSTGQIIRSSRPLADSPPPPLAAFLNRTELRVIHTDGSLLEIPISPIKPIREIPMPEPVTLQHAQFSADGNAVLTLQQLSADHPPQQAIISYQDPEDGSLEPESLARRFPWNLQPNVWTGVMRDSETPPFTVVGSSLKIFTKPQPFIEQGSPISAVAFAEKTIITGEKNGTLTVHRLLAPPIVRTSKIQPQPVNDATISALQNLTEMLAGCYSSPVTQAVVKSSTEERHQAFAACDFAAIQAAFPQLDFNDVRAEFQSIRYRNAMPNTFQTLDDRLVRATLAPKSSPSLEKIFREGRSSKVLAAIKNAGSKGPEAAKSLELALKSDQPAWIEACLASTVDLPPLVRRISVSRLAWLQGRKADVVSSWPEILPNLTEIRRSNDWDGWEQADFTGALENICQSVKKELAPLQIPKNATADQRAAVAARLLLPATRIAVGNDHYRDACMKVALACSAHREEATVAFQLAQMARELGAAAVPCLRIEAIALTAAGDFQEAHTRWIELITEHPVESQQARDYTEAAHSAFEMMDPSQAMEILITGLRHFPNDPQFAVRAGWIALLTGNFPQAYQFLLKGKDLGFPSDQIDQSLAVLTVAAAQVGATAQADAYFQELIQSHPQWQSMETLDKLEWPEELKSVLRLMIKPEIKPDLLPELAPTKS